MNITTLCDKIELQSCVKEKVFSFIENFDFQKIDNIKDFISCPYLPVGHGVALKALLEEDIEVIEGKVIDHYGILK